MDKIKEYLDGAFSIVDNARHPNIGGIEIVSSPDELIFNSWRMAGNSMNSSIINKLNSMSQEEKNCLTETIE